MDVDNEGIGSQILWSRDEVSQQASIAPEVKGRRSGNRA